jgi:flagellar assembly protein FliH
LPEVLQLSVADDAVRTLPAPGVVLDARSADAVERAVEAALDDARAQAFREGEAAGRAATVEAAERGAAALTQLRHELADQRAAATAASLELATAVAAAVLDRTPPDDALLVLERVRRAVALLDDAPLQVHLHPADHAVLAGMVLPPGVEPVADPSLGSGSARLRGAHGGAELTRSALFAAALEALGEDHT